jgi:hypothetical protein
MKITSSQANTQGKNIIVWLDFGPTAYINFGIVSALSKIDKFNFIGIVSTKQDISFFQNQQITPFQTLLYYPDCYIGKTAFDLNNLKKFEEKLNLNIWIDVLGERSFYKYWTEFHKFTKDEILSIVYHTMSFFVDVIETYKPKLVLTKQVGDNISSLLLYRIAKQLGVKILMPNQLYLRNKITISDNLVSREISDEFKKSITDFTNLAKTYDEEFIKNYDRSESVSLLLQGSNFRENFSQRISHYVQRLSTGLEPVYQNIGKTKLKMIRYRLQNFLEVKKRKQFLDSNSIKSVGNEKFLYFPLVSEPEARLVTTSPFYTNQITLVENIAKSIPIDFVLYVKEHPVQKLKLWRPVTDYKKIIDIPNVKFIHPSVSNHELLSKCQGVIAISGGTGFEAIFYKKPVILFADEHYDVLSMVTKIKKLTTLPNDITSALSNFKFNNNELAAFMHAFDKQSLSVPYHSIRNDAYVLSNMQMYVHDFNLTEKEFHKFYEIYKKYFELIAQTIYSKLYNS